ncbi:hypothetical protein TDIS_0046 [Thermosulfurimonas dismutans]|uniref:Uncharacterized protein n=1 Tax=Thermosulfurimonas dismutans TaxID=999894 RepID=A0A179D7E8_9BACT|nr:hypothetical protein TDIS_0046 [Thermosulfurimonas dismutans]
MGNLGFSPAENLLATSAKGELRFEVAKDLLFGGKDRLRKEERY